MKRYLSWPLCLLIVMGMQISMIAQDDVIEAEINEVIEIDIEEGRNEFAVEFEAEAGTVVYILTGAQELTFDDEVQLEIQNADGDEIGFSGEIILDPFAMAEIEEDGTYTAIIDYRAAEDNILDVIIGVTRVISEEAVSLEVGENIFADLALIRVEDDGEYQFTMTREDGNLAPAMTILDFSSSYPARIVDMSGTSMVSGSAIIELEDRTDYVLMIGENTYTTHNFYSMGLEAEMTLSLTPVE
jgi:hypothetical protein